MNSLKIDITGRKAATEVNSEEKQILSWQRNNSQFGVIRTAK